MNLSIFQGPKMNFLKFRDENKCLIKFKDQNSILFIFLIHFPIFDILKRLRIIFL